VTDFYLDIAKFPTAEELLRNKTADTIVVDAKFEYRPDLLSYDLYGNSSYWWVIVLLNRTQLQDPIRDLKPGMVLRVLSKSAINGII
jgi:hypothetical protein